MNESTLVPREEMNDLDWLARNVHVWPCGKHQPWCYVVTKIDGERTWASNVLSSSFPYSLVDKDQWLARRAELQNKPSWEDAPEWATWLAQCSDGLWYWYEGAPDDPDGSSWGDGVNNLLMVAAKGDVIGDWVDTLEMRPVEYFFKPIARVEDAATAKQPAPKGSGNPILGMVLADLTNRALEGKDKYGEPLLAHNGRNALWDLYQELLDAAMYIRQAIEEQKQ